MTNNIQDIILLSECLRENIKRNQFIIATVTTRFSKARKGINFFLYTSELRIKDFK